eukprot:m.194359 g.194359  ORF g.194359 m.194359 type:complete len:369 (+) comp32523_c0_seq1:150-1256(+)
MMKICALVACMAVFSNAQVLPLSGGDNQGNLILNASSGTILVDGKDLLQLFKLVNDLSETIEYLSGELQEHLEADGDYGNLVVTYGDRDYFATDDNITISAGSVQQVTFTGSGAVRVTVAGAQGGNGRWSNTDKAGGPGGSVTAEIEVADGDSWYVFVAEDASEKLGLAGAGGGSSDIRTVWSMGANYTARGTEFYNAFLETASLDSRLVIGGGGGGAHGGGYGFWGDLTQSPGAGGPDRTFTNSLGGNDAGHVDTGATVDTFGLDGGSSQSFTYTGDGKYGMGGQPESGIMDGVYSTTSGTYTGMAWPNGGSGTRWANGGGGGGRYGGAGNWPNGGGGSNYAADSVTVISNEGATQYGAGSVVIEIL